MLSNYSFLFLHWSNGRVCALRRTKQEVGLVQIVGWRLVAPNTILLVK